MSHVGYLQIRQKVFHFDTARCRWSGRDLDLEAEGKGIKFSLLGILPPRGTKLEELPGKEWRPTKKEQSECSDALYESAIECAGRWFVGQRLTRAACWTFDPENRKITMEFEAVYTDSESEREYRVEGTLSCEFLHEHPPEHLGIVEAIPRLLELGVRGIDASSGRAELLAAFGEPAEEGGNADVHGFRIPAWLRYDVSSFRIRFELDATDRITLVSFYR